MQKLDFIVIGAQKAGTTSLWQYLREHPGICMPRAKEVPFFTAVDAKPEDFEAEMQRLFADAPPGALLGKATPSYMIGNLVGRPGVDVRTVAERIATTLPDVKLIAVLRDPIERAISNYTMAVRREQEERSIDVALNKLLEPDALEGARNRPTHTNSYIVAGEYGRALGAYREHFPADQMLVTFTEDLASDPGAVLDEVLEFLGLEAGFRPENLGTYHFRGGQRKLLDAGAKEKLVAYYRREILPHMQGRADLHLQAFEFFLTSWNVAPGDKPPTPSDEVRKRLESHFRRDAERLAALGVRAPWTDLWGNA